MNPSAFSQRCAGNRPARRSRSTVRSLRSSRLTVGPLSVGAIHRMLWGRLSLNLPRPALLRVHETAGGNPFYALELGRALADGTILPGSGPLPLPESLQSVVAARLDTLPRRVRDTLAAVAALSAPTVTLLEALAPEAVDDIERAQAHGVLELDGDRIRFTHPLFAPACYSAMPLHGDAVFTLASLGWTSISRNVPAISPSRRPGRTRRSRTPGRGGGARPCARAPRWLRRSSPSWRSR